MQKTDEEKEHFNKLVGVFVQTVRVKLGMSQQTFAAELNIAGLTSVSRWERSETAPSAPVLLRIMGLWIAYEQAQETQDLPARVIQLICHLANPAAAEERHIRGLI